MQYKHSYSIQQVQKKIFIQAKPYLFMSMAGIYRRIDYLFYNILESKMLKTLVCLLIVSVLAYSIEIDPNYNYDKFCVQFGRDYTGEEYNQHKAIFDANYAELLENISNGLDQKVSKFMDWNETQLQNFLVSNPEEILSQASPAPLQSSGSSQLPVAFNWADHGIITPIKDQGGCGSCWAFSATAHYESLLKYFDSVEYDLSEQYMIECAYPDSDRDFCINGFANKGLKLIKQQSGLPLETSLPYIEEDTHTCPSLPSGVYFQNQTISQYISYVGNRSIETLKQELLTYGPYIVSVYSNTPGFLNVGDSGIVNCPAYQHDDIDHFVQLVGYDEDYWIIKNSWGTGWGDDGFGKVPIYGNDCNIRRYIMYFVTDGNIVAPENPPEPSPVNLTINMIDTYGDGLNGNIFAFKQNGEIVATFGENFTTGSSFSQIVEIPNVYTEVVVYQFGSWKSQIGFTIERTSDNFIFFTRSPGNTFMQNQIFAGFCPDASDCTVPQTEQVFYLMLSDTYGDGWNDNILKFVYGSTQVTFGELFTEGVSFTQAVRLDRTQQIQVEVDTIGTYTYEVGFKIFDQDGNQHFSFGPDQYFYANSILGTFCLNCLNFSPVRIADSKEQQEKKSEENEGETDIRLKVAAGILGGIAIIAIIGFFLLLVRYKQLKSKLEQRKPIDTIGSGSNFRAGGVQVEST